MTRENAATRATRFLVEARVMIEAVNRHTCVARVRGDSGQVRLVRFDGWKWSCDCPARTRCAHQIAIMRVVVVEPDGS